MRTVVIKSELNALTKRKNMLQKEVYASTGIGKSTINEYFSGSRPMPIEKAALVNEKVGDSQFAQELGNKYFGTLKALDGKVSETLTPTELDFLEEQETLQREARREQAKALLIKSKLEPLNKTDKDDLEKYVLEFLDEIIIELSIVFSILKILGMSMSTAFNKRMPHWVKIKYMKG